MKAKPIYFTILFLALITISCNYFKKNKSFDYGNVENNIYTNTFFELGIQTPLNWVSQTNKQLANLNILKNDSLYNVDDIINPSDVDLAYLLTIFKNEVVANNDYNPNFILIVEKQNSDTENDNCSHNLSKIKDNLKQSQIQYNSFDEEFKRKIINNKEFYVMNCSINYLDKNVTQRYYSTCQNGYYLNAIISFVDDAQKDDLEMIVNSIEFNN